MLDIAVTRVQERDAALLPIASPFSIYLNLNPLNHPSYVGFDEKSPISTGYQRRVTLQSI